MLTGTELEVTVDLNVRVRGRLTYVNFEDVSGDIPEPGVSVTAVEKETGLRAPGIVTEVDPVKELVYLAVAWRELS